MDLGGRHHICIVTPGQIGSNPRVVKEADALHEAGYRVTVIATRALDRVEPRDQALMQRIGWTLKRVDLSMALKWKGLRLVQTGWGLLHRMTGSARLADFAFNAVTPVLRSAALEVPADLYIAHYPAALPAAAAVAKRFGAKLAYDAEDFHLGDWPNRPEFDHSRQLVRNIEEHYLGRCAHITVAAAGIAQAYEEAYGVPRPAVIRNVFPLRQAPATHSPRGGLEPRPTIYWFSQMIGPDRGLEFAVQAICRSRSKPVLHLRGTVAEGFAERLSTISQKANGSCRIVIHPPAAPDDMERLAAIHDAGLVAETDVTRSREIALTNKLFTFLMAGVPPVMSDIPAHRDFASTYGLSHLVYSRNDPDSLAGILDRLLLDDERLAADRKTCWDLARSVLNWDREKVLLLRLVEAAGLEPHPCSAKVA